MRLRDIGAVAVLVLAIALAMGISYNLGYNKAKRDMAMMVFKTLQQQFKRQ